ncbi:hypothetical protein PGTUg99_020067 [Puccinia graminis f. sp. tritici]|uniref:RING-type domain-containing protein n=1 Tax=Puccinia graminis f. sp. tritici TaxID=56615 RepID=A0A5B0RCS9_PUCGR|nr:hypothetical protein PGTUg99_020067 [Puccinia graminis f. sp. tritici]
MIVSTEIITESDNFASPSLNALWKTMHQHSKRMVHNDGTDSNQCAICLASLHDGRNICRLPDCQHPFHTLCLDGWQEMILKDAPIAYQVACYLPGSPPWRGN